MLIPPPDAGFRGPMGEARQGRPERMSAPDGAEEGERERRSRMVSERKEEGKTGKSLQN